MPMQHAVDRSQRQPSRIRTSRISGSAPGATPVRRGRLGAIAIGLLIASLAVGVVGLLGVVAWAVMAKGGNKNSKKESANE